jgi:hypothetical protein
MKWELPIKGQIRYRKKFAWFPIETPNHKIWLEFYQVEEMYVEGFWIVQKIIEN